MTDDTRPQPTSTAAPGRRPTTRRACATCRSRRCRASRSTRSTATARTRASTRTRGASTPRCTGRGCGRCGCSPASARPRTPTPGSRSCCAAGGTGLSTAFDMPTLMGRDSDNAVARAARSAGPASRSTRSPTWRTCSPTSTSASVTTSMTINGPASIVLAMYIAVAEKTRRRAGRPGRARSRTTSSRSTRRRRSTSSRRGPSVRLVTDLMRFTTAEMPRWHPVSISGLPHPRGRLDRRAGAGVHARQRLRLRRGGVRRRARRRRLRPPPVVLLQLPHRLLRGDRQVPRRPAHLGPLDARALRRQGRALPALRVPHPDRGRVAHRAAARDQHRPRRAPGAGRGARRARRAAHRLLRRGAGAADREGGAHRPAHPADHRPRDRRGQRGRPAGRRRTTSSG